MNHFFTFIFLIVIFFYYRLLGSTITNYFEVKNRSAIVDIICGFITLFFISFIIGVPCQFFQLNWYVYFLLFSLIFIISFIFLLKKKYSNFTNFKSQLFSFFSKKKIINHLKNNWVLYVFVFLFTLFSVSNVMALYEFDYDDAFYIGKVVNSISTPALLNEDFFTGNLANGVDFARLINTYEITYAAFSTLFRINPTYLCKVTMAIHNYILFALCIKQLALYISKEKAQYALLPFFIFLINHGYLIVNNFFNIRSYDLWQFQNAMWYGGSVVRVLSIPIMCIICIPLIENRIKIKNLVFVAMYCCSMMSFSTIFAPILVIMFFILFILKFSFNCYLFLKQKNYKLVIINFLGLCLFVFVLFLTKKLDHSPFLNMQNYESFNNELYPFYCYYLLSDIIIKYSKYIILFTLVLTFKSKYGKYITLITFLLLKIVCSNYFNELLCVTSLKFFFVILRFYSSIQFMIVALLGISIAKIFDIIKFKTISFSLTSLAIACTLNFINVNYSDIKSVNFLGCGINNNGYDFTQFFKYDNLMLDPFNEVGKYFNSLPYGNYTLLAPEAFKFKGSITYQQGFALSSNRIQIERTSSLNENRLKYRNAISHYLDDSATFNDTKFAFEFYKGSYLLTFSKNQSYELENLGYKIVYKGKNYFIIHI